LILISQIFKRLQRFKYLFGLLKPMSKEKVVKLLKKLTKTKEVKLISRESKAIFIALQIAKRLGKTDVVMQDQGGWLTYRHHAFKLGMHVVYLRTNYGIIETEKLEDKINPQSVLIVNSLSGYFAEQPMKQIAKIAKRKRTLLINDVSGSIGTKNARYGDIIICSFNKWKPIDLGEGSFIAVNNPKYFRFFEIEEAELDYDELLKKIENLPARLKFFEEKCKKIKKDLGDMNILHKKSRGINVVIGFENDKEKERIIEYCNKNMFPFITCPREIRVNRDAISIEVKRLSQEDKFKNVEEVLLKKNNE